MTRIVKTLVAIVCLALLAPAQASAHAFLDHAVPGVGATVATAPDDIELTFTQSIVVALSGVTLKTLGGGVIAVAKPKADAAKSDVIRVSLGKPLPPGVYVVTWRAVSIDTHPTSGSYRFTVSP